MSLPVNATDSRWTRLFQPSNYPWNAADLRGADIHVDPEVSDAHDLARLLELASKPACNVWPMLTSVGETGSQTDWETYWADNVSTWESATGKFHQARAFSFLYERYRNSPGPMISPLRLTIARKQGGPLVIWSYLIIDPHTFKCVDHINLYSEPLPGLDAAIEELLARAGITLPYRPASQTADAYRHLFETFPITWACPEYIRYNLWSDWLLYARLVFSDVELMVLFDAIGEKFEEDVIADNLLLNFYATFTLDANFHAFDTVDYVVMYPKASDMWRYIARLSARVDELIRAVASGSQIAAVFSAGLRKYLSDGGDAFRTVYAKWMKMKPDDVLWVVPTGQDCGGWVPKEEWKKALKSVFDAGKLKIGYVDKSPYTMAQSGKAPTGIDCDIAAAVVKLISDHYAIKVTTEWVEAKPLPTPLGGDPEADNFNTLYAGLEASDYDLAMSGQLVLGSPTIGTADPAWTGATARIFTAITYTGKELKGVDLMNIMKGLHRTDRATFIQKVAPILNDNDVVLTFFSVVNPGPSPGSAQDLVTALNNARRKSPAPKGAAAWVTGTVDDSAEAMKGRYYFTVGDGIAGAWQTVDPDVGFKGVYLDIPAVDQPSLLYDASVRSATLLPMAAFALKDA